MMEPNGLAMAMSHLFSPSALRVWNARQMAWCTIKPHLRSLSTCFFFFCDPSAVASSEAGITAMYDNSWQEPPLLTGTQLLTLSLIHNRKTM